MLFGDGSQMQSRTSELKKKKNSGEKCFGVIFGWNSDVFDGTLVAEMICLVKLSHKGSAQAVFSVSLYVDGLMWRAPPQAKIKTYTCFPAAGGGAIQYLAAAPSRKGNSIPHVWQEEPLPCRT